MGLITKDYTFSVGAIIQAAEHNQNFDEIYTEFNGNIQNANIASDAAIVDTKLAQITTASKVTLGALTVASEAQGDITYRNASAWTRLAAGTSGFYLKTQGASANPKWDILLPVVSTLTDGANIATDAALGNVFTVTLAGNRTLDNPTNGVNGQKIVWRIRQDGTGSRTLAYGTAFRFGTDVTSPTLTTAANKTDYIGAIYNSTDSKWDVVAVAKGY